MGPQLTNTQKKNTHLSTRHQIPEGRYDRYRILLDRGWSGVTREFDVVQQELAQRRVRERRHRLKLLGACHFDWNIVVLFEINSGVLLERIGDLAVQLFFHALVARSNDMLAIHPSSIAS